MNKDIATDIGEEILRSVEWVQRERTPRQEAFYCKHDVDYTYGSGAGERTYSPNLDIPDRLRDVWAFAEALSGTKYEACFLNRYDNEREHLGWHADDSGVIDDSRPIAVISYGAERELWFRENTGGDVEKLLLENGSMLLMHAGMQDTHQHRIPKHHAKCSTRISLTLRGLIL